MKRCKAGILLLIWGCASSLIATPVAAAQTASFAQQLYGTWYTYPPANPTKDFIRHEFRLNLETGKDEIIVSHVCEGDEIAVIARAVSPIEVSQNTIHILQSASRSEKETDGTVCHASVDSGIWAYVISSTGDRMSITNRGGTPDRFQLARQDVAPEAVLPASVYGTWLLPVHEQRGTTVQIKLIFYESADNGKGKIRQISTCAKANDSVVSQADSTFKIVKDEITILEAARREQRNGPISCLATIVPGTLHYVISPDGGTMVLSKPGAPPLILTRER